VLATNDYVNAVRARAASSPLAWADAERFSTIYRDICF
jgi:hypothetical protein